jgi:dipeptidyl aminopeptidase/acylaminoacyl peptidase
MEHAGNGGREIPDLAYSGDGNKIKKLDIFLPDDRGPWPLFIFFHGGALEEGNRKDGASKTLRNLAARGIAFASADYRMYPGASFPDYIHDAAEAVSFAIRYGEGKLFDKIFIGGSSAGAYLSMMLCFNPAWLEKAGAAPEQVAGYVFDAGQPTVHFNILRERGLDTRRIVIDEAAPFYYLNEQFIAGGLKPRLLFITASDDIPGRLEQNRLLIKTLEQFGYDMGLVGFRLMEGYQHTGYTESLSPSGGLLYADMIEEFINADQGKLHT